MKIEILEMLLLFFKMSRINYFERYLLGSSSVGAVIGAFDGVKKCLRVCTTTSNDPYLYQGFDVVAGTVAGIVAGGSTGAVLGILAPVLIPMYIYNKNSKE